jgi:hypothetical protein
MGNRSILFSHKTPLKGISCHLQRTICEGVYDVIRDDHSAPKKLRQAVSDNLNPQAPSYANLPKFIQNIFSSPEKFQNLIIGLTPDEIISILCENIIKATNEFEQCLEESVFVFKLRFKEKLTTWLKDHDITTLEMTLKHELDGTKPRLNGLSFINDFLLKPNAMTNVRRLVLTEKHAQMLIMEVMKEVIQENYFPDTNVSVVPQNDVKTFRP